MYEEVAVHHLAHLVGDTLSNQHQHDVASVGIHRDQAHDTLAVVSL